MNNLTSFVKKVFLHGLLSAIVALVGLTAVEGRATVQDQTDRQKGIALYEANNFVAALPFLEKAALANPQDPVILSRLGFALYATSVTEKDLNQRQKTRDRARTTLLKSQSLGDDSNLTKITVDSLTYPDADAIPFSNMKAADTAIREGEEAFVRGDMEKALAAYKRALALDPKLYDAALYAGDVEFKKAHSSNESSFRAEHFDQAGIWFAKAIAINPNREAAYRYWGDALEAQGKSEDARDKFVDAIIAEPYNRRAYVGLTQWAERHQVSLGHLRIDIPVNVAPGKIELGASDPALKSSDDGSAAAAWLTYGLIRSSWNTPKNGSRSERFAQAYPNEPAYRHSLAEEVEALRGVLKFVDEQTKNKTIKGLTPALENLAKLNEMGFIEAYILFARPDEGISRDYAAYRKSNRDKLRKYWLELVVQAN